MTHPTTAPPPTGRRLLCIGLGYTARVLARRLAGEGFAVTGTSRTAAGVDAITRDGWQAILFDGTSASPALAGAIGAASHVLISASPDGAGDPVLRWHHDDLAGAGGIAWIGYLSTVGVYGDRGGDWVDETTPPQPTSTRSRNRLAAEEAWLRFAGVTGKRVEVFRLPGIYGPGRSAIEALKAGTARRIDKPGQVFNRMHVADIAMALAAAIGGLHTHALYNLVDDEPAPAETVVAYAAHLLGLPAPPLVPFADAGLSPMAASFYSETKRVANRRMKAGLGIRLRYPTYREGLEAIVRGEV